MTPQSNPLELPQDFDRLIEREALLKMQINALDTWFKAAVNTLTEELDQVTDAKLAIWEREIEEYDAKLERKAA